MHQGLLRVPVIAACPRSFISHCIIEAATHAIQFAEEMTAQTQGVVLDSARRRRSLFQLPLQHPQVPAA